MDLLELKETGPTGHQALELIFSPKLLNKHNFFLVLNFSIFC